jgi:ankyrin repeat protein
LYPHAYPTRWLPAQPNLEQLRKQAKDLLAAYRASDPAAVAEVERFERTPDPARFALTDAQRVLARAYGYESWPKLKAFVDGANIAHLAEAVQSGDLEGVRALIQARPELVGMDRAGNDEHRALHYAVLRRDAGMVRLLMESGADARKGIYPHRDATTAFALARDREYHEIVQVIEEEEQRRRQAMSCPNAAVSPVQDRINQAIRQGDDAQAMRLLAADEALIRACDRNGRTPLHVAAASGGETLVAWLLAKGASPRKTDLEGLSALDRAALAAHPHNNGAERFPAVARMLLERGAEMTVRAAVALGDDARVRELVGANRDVLREIDWRRGGLLSLAVNHGQVEMVRLLLDLGADVDERTTLREVEEPTVSWGTPLWHAALARHREIVELLLDRGADPNANVYASGWPLRNAYPDRALRNLLLERGARRQPYMVAEENDVEEARRMLASDPTEHVVEELAWSAADHGAPEVLALALPHLEMPRNDPRWNWFLIQPIRGVEDDGRDHEGFFRALALLLAHGIDPNVSRRFGQTVLHFAAANDGPAEAERVRFVAMLLDAGARLDTRDDLLGSTPLGWACRWGRPGMVDLLLARGAPAAEPGAEPWATPLAWALKMGHKAIAERLRSQGAVS